MDRHGIIKKRMIQVRSVIYALIVISCFLVIFLFGISSVFRIGFIAVFFAVNIFMGIMKIKNSSYSNSVFKEILNAVIITLIFGLVLIFTSYPKPSIDGRLPFQYSFSKMYTDKYCSADQKLLPEKLPDDVSDYHFFYFPGFLQGDPMLELNFTTNSDELSRIEKSAEKCAVGVLDLEMYRQDKENTQVAEFIKSYFKGNTLDYFEPRTGLAGENEGSGKMYIIESNGNCNHPHTSCITVNYETCMASYTY